MPTNESTDKKSTSGLTLTVPTTTTRDSQGDTPTTAQIFESTGRPAGLVAHYGPPTTASNKPTATEFTSEFLPGANSDQKGREILQALGLKIAPQKQSETQSGAGGAGSEASDSGAVTGAFRPEGPHPSKLPMPKASWIKKRDEGEKD